MENSKIQWCHHTFNHIRGCTKVSAGCANCYAETMSGRNPGTLGVWGPNGTRVVASETMWGEPVEWNRKARDGVCPNCNGKGIPKVTIQVGNKTKRVFATDGAAYVTCETCRGSGKVDPYRARVFCASLADVFEDWGSGAMHASNGKVARECVGCRKWFAEDTSCSPCCGANGMPLIMQDVRTRLFRLIDATPNLDWMLLTKRPENIARMMPGQCSNACECECHEVPNERRKVPCEAGGCWDPRPNLWLGTSVENQQTADERIPHLLRVPATVRFLSMEPLLGPVDVTRYLGHVHSFNFSAQTPTHFPGIDWAIVGGESGHGARPCHVDWVRSIVKQCQDAKVPVFVKQLGANVEWNGIQGGYGDGPSDCWPVTPKMQSLPGRFRIKLLDDKGGDIEEWPEDLRVREFPTLV